MINGEGEHEVERWISVEMQAFNWPAVVKRELSWKVTISS